MSFVNRRRFLAQSIATLAAASLGARGLAQASDASASITTAGAAPLKELKRAPALAPDLVRDFVSAGHRDLPKIRELLAAHPTVVNASWDLGGGDWETALGAASHVGRSDIARHLLENGARFDAFCAAMMGETDLVVSLLRFSSATANARGPHGFSLLYHAGYSGSVRIAKALEPHLAERARDCNQALLSATVSKQTDFVAWLLQHGVDNPNLTAPNRKTPLDLAVANGAEEIARLLRAAGGRSSS